MKWDGPDGYWVSDDAAKIDVAWVHAWLSRESYWAPGRPLEVVTRSIASSIVFGLFTPQNAQVGFARIVTDRSTFGWLCDVFVDAAHEGRGLGSFLVETALSHPDIDEIRLVLMAEPGRSIYQRRGFVPLLRPERWMERPAKKKP